MAGSDKVSINSAAVKDPNFVREAALRFGRQAVFGRAEYTQKSAEELAWLRRAAELTDLSCAALRDGATPGHTEHELVALVEGAYLPLGGANYIHYFSITSMASPEQCVPAQWPSDRRLGIIEWLVAGL